MTVPREMSLFSKLDLVPGIGSVLISSAYAAVAAPFQSQETKCKDYKLNLTSAAIRKMMNRFNGLQVQFLSPALRKTYAAICNDEGIEPEYVSTAQGVKGFWCGDHQTAKYIIVNYHGGGYSVDGTPEHVKYWHSLQKHMASHGTPIAVLFCEYPLTPQESYPAQLSAGVEALRYVLEDLKRPPSEIIIAGDSAGGNLTLGVMSHLVHPHPEIPKVELSGALKGALPISPWVSFRTDWSSYKRNETKDYLAIPFMNYIRDALLAGKPADQYTEPEAADADWWKDSKVENVLITAGQDEVLLDQIAAWVDKFKVFNPDAKYVEGKDELHIHSIFCVGANGLTGSETSAAIETWMRSIMT